MKRRKLPARAYPPGYFTAPVRAWRGAFGPLWSPRWPELVTRTTSGHTIADRERQVAEGTGWAGGTVSQPNTPQTMRPGWIR